VFCSSSFTRLDGPNPTGPIYFLPIGVDFVSAAQWGLIATSDWRACYELSEEVLHPDPKICARSLQRIGQDVADGAEMHGSPDLLIGFSIGTVPATIAAKQFRSRLWSFASADRGELMIWSSRKARHIRDQAERLGYHQHDFAYWLRDLNPIDCIDGIHSDSRLVFGAFDRYVPSSRRLRLAEKAAGHLGRDKIITLPLGHFGVLLASRWLQQWWLGNAQPAL
jgi:hypothetical protein